MKWKGQDHIELMARKERTKMGAKSYWKNLCSWKIHQISTRIIFNDDCSCFPLSWRIRNSFAKVFLRLIWISIRLSECSRDENRNNNNKLNLISFHFSIVQLCSPLHHHRNEAAHSLSSVSIHWLTRSTMKFMWIIAALSLPNWIMYTQQKKNLKFIVISADFRS